MTPTAASLVLAASLSQALPQAPPPHGLPLPGLPAPPAADPTPSPVETARRRHPRPIDPVVLRALFAEDPPVGALRQAATALALAEPARARSMLARARLAGWLPELRLLIERRFARSESVDLGSAADPAALAPVGIDSNNDVRYQARATWDLSRIAFNPDEIAVASQALRTADTRREIESLVIRLYFERRRLKVESVGADDSDMPSGSRRELRIAEVEAELDALTGGAFTRLARRHSIEGEFRSEP